MEQSAIKLQASSKGQLESRMKKLIYVINKVLDYIQSKMYVEAVI